ncbi:hypothetical protein ANCCAN_17533 [Ancylostoma caninum]|uniref:Uncharacterized protein n=1 Tax=Ancylostoma caninum TaxID=29170 RepID=A0A368FYL5_ANCCA|nr:hypothetical protein ANCCAN_17533 [Ancylostoma caninum]
MVMDSIPDSPWDGPTHFMDGSLFQTPSIPEDAITEDIADATATMIAETHVTAGTAETFPGKFR